MVTCYLGNEQYGNIFGVDVALGEPILGAPEIIVAADRLAFIGVEAPKLRVYPIESHIAEKLHAYTLPRSGPNGRVKDLPDLALLAQIRPIGRTELRGALQQTFHFRAVHPLPTRFPDPPGLWEQSYAALARDNHLQWATLVEVTAAARAFVEPVLGDASAAEWDPAAWAWRAAAG
ncbi:nucleotidyl transferase AbiEii/AbiGii toxin family protein [Nannocystis pusilla]|uniref:nucleotidyl transferase AbiEii/AbiGii toxin family protein n=1 Tax=Nannocystis pusilla TaxID=889268 RepID=UPI003B7A4A50